MLESSFKLVSSANTGLFYALFAVYEKHNDEQLPFVLSPPAMRFIMFSCVIGFSNAFILLDSTPKLSMAVRAALFGLSTRAAIAFVVALSVVVGVALGVGVFCWRLCQRF